MITFTTVFRVTILSLYHILDPWTFMDLPEEIDVKVKIHTKVFCALYYLDMNIYMRFVLLKATLEVGLIWDLYWMQDLPAQNFVMN